MTGLVPILSLRGCHQLYPVAMKFLTKTLYSASKRPRPSILADIRDAEVTRERASMIARWGPPIYGLVDIRDRIGTRRNLPTLAPARADEEHRTPIRNVHPRTRSGPRRPRRGEAEMLEASMNEGERETYQQHASTADATEKPQKRLRLRSTRVRGPRD